MTRVLHTVTLPGGVAASSAQLRWRLSVPAGFVAAADQAIVGDGTYRCDDDGRLVGADGQLGVEATPNSSINPPLTLWHVDVVVRAKTIATHRLYVPHSTDPLWLGALIADDPLLVILDGGEPANDPDWILDGGTP